MKTDYPPNDDGFMPMGLAMSLSVSRDAMDAFSALSPAEQDSVMNRARGAESRGEMDDIVRALCEK